MAGTTNMLPWNPTAANQETDSEYVADSQRTGGATDPSVFDALLANKLFYQCTIFLTALFSAFANKGFTTSDADLATLTAQCANFLTSADVRPGIITVSFSSSLTLDCSQADGFAVTLTGNVTSLTLSNATAGQEIDLCWIQDSVGGRTITYPSNVYGAGAPAAMAGSSNTQRFKVYPDLSIRASGPVTVS